jgi:hypothetical protein
MVQSSLQDPEFRTAVPQYRPTSRLALLTLLLGLLSPLALAHPLLAIISFGTLVMGVITLKAMTSEQGGRGMVVVALLVASLCTGWGLARHLSWHRVHYDLARPFADDWLQLVAQNDLLLAHQLTFEYQNRSDFDKLEKHYEKPDDEGPGPGMYGSVPYHDMLGFFENRPLREIRRLPGGFRFEYMEGVAVDVESSGRTRVLLRYRILPQQGGAPFDVIVSLYRRVGDGTALWWISQVLPGNTGQTVNLAEPREW